MAAEGTSHSSSYQSQAQDYARFYQDQVRKAQNLWHSDLAHTATATAADRVPFDPTTVPSSLPTLAGVTGATKTSFSWFDMLTSIFYSWIGVILIIVVICYLMYTAIKINERVSELEHKTRTTSDPEYLRHLIQNNNMMFSKYQDQALKITIAQLKDVQRAEHAEVLSLYNSVLQDLIASAQAEFLTETAIPAPAANR
jgi:hypothetical protein